MTRTPEEARRVFRSRYISVRVWRKLPRDLRRELLRILPRSLLVSRYSSDVATSLCNRGEHDLARRLREALNPTEKEVSQ